MSTIKEGAKYVEINGKFVSAGYARSHAAKNSGQPVAELVRAESEHNQRGAGQDQSVEESPSGVRYSILIVSYRKRLLDSHDNLRTAHKALVDRITERYGFQSDSDPRLQWHYAQIQTSGVTGTHVVITRVADMDL